MTAARIALLAAASASAVGFAVSLLAPFPTPEADSASSAPDKGDARVAPPEPNLPAFPFDSPFDARAAFEKSLDEAHPARRIGMWMAIGYHAAQNDPQTNIAALEPEFWQAPYYDLRGALLAEWMRLDPESFLAWAEPKFETMHRAGQAASFPVYHLAYLEPERLLQLVSKIAYDPLAEFAKGNLLHTLVEKDPDLLWERRDAIAPLKDLIAVASGKGLHALALDFWERSGWVVDTLPHSLVEHLGQAKRTDLARHLGLDSRNAFAAAFAAAHPSDAARWVRRSAALQRFEHEFDAEHLPFFRSLLRQADFAEWSDAPLWLAEATLVDQEQALAPRLLSTLERNPILLTNGRLRDQLREYLLRAEDGQTLKSAYLSLDAAHPLTKALEGVMLLQQDRYGDALALRAARDRPTPERLLQAMSAANHEDWPEAFAEAARKTLAQLSNHELQWQLSPDQLLAAHQLDPERVQDLLADADPQWISSTLASPRFLSKLRPQTLDTIDPLLRHLPSEEAQRIRENARQQALRNIDWNADKAPYLEIAQAPNEAALLSYAFTDSELSHDDSLRQAIAEHPHSEAIYLAIAQRPGSEALDSPELQQARATLERARQMLYQPQAQIVATLQQLDPPERLQLMKAAQLTALRFNAVEVTEPLIDQPLWTEAERDQLRSFFRPPKS